MEYFLGNLWSRLSVNVSAERSHMLLALAVTGMRLYLYLY